MLPEQPSDSVTSDSPDPVTSNPIDPIASDSPNPVANNPIDPVASDSPNPVTSNQSDPVISDSPNPITSNPTDPVISNPTNPVTSNPPKPVTSEKIVRISEFRLLLLLAAFVIIVTSILGGVGVAMDYQNHMRASVTATAGEATSRAMNNATYTAAVATSQVISGTTATAIANVTATVQANPYPSYLAGKGTLAFVDPLSQPDEHWINNSNSSYGETAQFTQGAYHVSESRSGLFTNVGSDELSNFALEVQMTIASGDCGGIAFRNNFTAGGFYFFDVCQNGLYGLFLYRDLAGTNIQTLTSGSSAATHTGYNQSNVIAVIANGSSIDLYVNNQQIDSANDGTYSFGGIALCAEDVSSPTEVVYSNARLWTL